MDIKKIGQGIQRNRLAKNLSQQGLAERVGISVRYIEEIERGGRVPKLETFLKILNALDASADDVLAENLNAGYRVIAGRLEQKLEPLSVKGRRMVLNVIETIIETMQE